MKLFDIIVAVTNWLYRTFPGIAHWWWSLKQPWRFLVNGAGHFLAGFIITWLLTAPGFLLWIWFEWAKAVIFWGGLFGVALTLVVYTVKEGTEGGSLLDHLWDYFTAIIGACCALILIVRIIG